LPGWPTITPSCCEAANGIAAEWADREAARLLIDAATLAEIGA
jgi:hypothetical protein